MANISDLSEELLVKIISFLPTIDAVSTSILSKQWRFLWMWCHILEFDSVDDESVRDFINKNLPLHRAPMIKKLRLNFFSRSNHADDYKTWVAIAVSRGLHELSISYDSMRSFCTSSYYSNVFLFLPSTLYSNVFLFLPSTLYTCNSLVTLDLVGMGVLVDVPQEVCLPNLKKMHLTHLTYSNKDSLRLLLSCCPVLEDLLINRHYCDRLEALVIMIPSLRRLSVFLYRVCGDDRCVIVTPSLKYFKLCDERRYNWSYSIEHMPELEEAYISLPKGSYWEDLLKSISTVKRLSLVILVRDENETLYGDGIVFSKLESLKLEIDSDN